MTDKRTVIIGMNNPYGQRPDMALYPAPERCAGWNLWRMLADAGARRGYEIHRKHYIDAFDRRNVLSAPQWSRAEARRAAEDLLPTLAGRRVIVLGAETADVLRLPRTEVGEWREAHVDIFLETRLMSQMSAVPGPEATEPIQDRVRCTHLPHPSGRNRVYNDRSVWAAAGELLLAEFLSSPVARELVLRPPAG